MLVNNGNFIIKQAGTTFLTFIFFLFHTSGICGPLEFEKAIDYKPPRPLYGHFQLKIDPGDDPFSGDGMGFQCLSYDQCSSVIFQLGIVRFQIGNGKAVKFLSTSPSDLKSELESQWKDKFPNVTPATIGKLNEFTTVSLTAFRSGDTKPSLFQVCWVQIETNMVLKITAVSCDATTFNALTNSLQSLKINKSRLLASLKPRKPEVTTQRLDKVTVGYIPTRPFNGRYIAAFIFCGEQRTFAFTAVDNGNPAVPVNSAAKWLEKLCDLSNQKDSLRMAVFEIGENEVSLGYDERTCGFIAETNKTAIELAKKNDFHCPTALNILSWQDNGNLEGFQKIAEYKMDATLFIRKREIDY